MVKVFRYLSILVVATHIYSTKNKFCFEVFHKIHWKAPLQEPLFNKDTGFI